MQSKTEIAYVVVVVVVAVVLVVGLVVVGVVGLLVVVHVVVVGFVDVVHLVVVEVFLSLDSVQVVLLEGLTFLSVHLVVLDVFVVLSHLVVVVFVVVVRQSSPLRAACSLRTLRAATAGSGKAEAAMGPSNAAKRKKPFMVASRVCMCERPPSDWKQEDC